MYVIIINRSQTIVSPLSFQVGAGFSGIRDVYASTPDHDDVQQSFLLAETFK